MLRSTLQREVILGGFVMGASSRAASSRSFCSSSSHIVLFRSGLAGALSVDSSSLPLLVLEEGFVLLVLLAADESDNGLFSFPSSTASSTASSGRPSRRSSPRGSLACAASKRTSLGSESPTPTSDL